MPSSLTRSGIERLIHQLSTPELVYEFFQLGAWGVTPAALTQQPTGSLADWIAQTVLDPAVPWQGLAVRTSGTTGTPRTIHHSRQFLEDEVSSWCAMLPDARRVCSMVPAHHLYGLIWTVLWPGAASLPVLDCRRWSRQDWQSQLKPGDVVVAVPVQWAQLLSLLKPPAGVIGISSAGELSEPVWNAALRLGLSRILEIYGSTETGGVATRTDPAAPFTLAAHWQHRRHDLAAVLPDEIELLSSRHFRLLRRKDGAIKIAGRLVELDVVRRAVLAFPGVSDCYLRTVGPGEAIEIEALVIAGAAGPDFGSALQRYLTQHLHSCAIPRRVTIRPDLPVDAMGKVTVW